MKRILVIAVLCLLMATPPASAEKCDFAGNTAAGIQKCFGASGQHCEGEPNHGTQKNDKDCTVTAWVSVGSIMHDNCCLDDEKGKWCEGIGKGVWDDVTFKDDSTRRRPQTKGPVRHRAGLRGQVFLQHGEFPAISGPASVV